MVKKNIPDFSNDQWRFLAVLAVFKTRVSMRIAGHLVPLMPGPLFDVITHAKKRGWIEQSSEDSFRLSHNLPMAVRNKLAEIYATDDTEILISRLDETDLAPDIKSEIKIRIMEKGGQGKKASQQDLRLAEDALGKGNNEKACRHYQQAAKRLKHLTGDTECKSWFLSCVLKYSNLSFILGKQFGGLAELLHIAHEVSAEYGDRRSHALINMHLGRLYYFSDRRSDALIALSVGLTEIEELGDEDILNQSAAFLGLYYFMQGLFKDALPHLERAAGISDTQPEKHLFNPLAPILLGYCLAYLGKFHQAIGNLDSNWRSARKQSNDTLAMSLRVILGTVLILINREKEAIVHIDAAIKEAEKTNNAFALYLARGAVNLRLMKSGQIVSAYQSAKQTFEEFAQTGLIRQYASPWILEMLYTFEKQGLEPIPDLSFRQAMDRSIKENNVHLYGVALRLLSRKKMAEGLSGDKIKKDLIKSKKLLEQSGDIVQLSKTIIDLARLELTMGNRKEAGNHAHHAWKVLGGYAADFFPNDLHHLLESEETVKHSQELSHDAVERFIELTESIFPVYSQEDILTRTIIATNRFFDAERGGLFWFPGGKMTHHPELRASCNLSQSDVSEPGFTKYRSFILKAFQENRPLIMRNIKPDNLLPGRPVKALLCVPVIVRDKVRAVIYHDNSYLEDCFDALSPETIRKIGAYISRQVAGIYDYFRLRKERNDLISEKSLQDAAAGEKLLVYKCSLMTNLISQIDKAADSDSTILLLGETGVGKELLARRIHEMSRRNTKPFIIVDANTIPESLIESELFGHEKGAFTGADKQKKGRLELANQGTLLIDEIGEIPKSVQVKLLRVIQERTFFRVGGTATLHSDFRLIAATNRNLLEEVSAGRFREDLYYRLNVVPFRVLSLKERADDIPLLAKHFLIKYSLKYHRSGLRIDPETEAMLIKYNWPGNIRELENIIERAVLLSSGDKLDVSLTIADKTKNYDFFSDHPTVDELQKRYIHYILSITDGKISGPGGASEILGLKRTTLLARLKKLGLR